MELEEADEMVSNPQLCLAGAEIIPTKVSQMEIEMQGIPQSLRSQYQSRVRRAQADLVKYKKVLKEIQTRTNLLSSNRRAGLPSSDEPYNATSDRQRLLSGTALLEDGSKRLQESQRVALETEEQGADILMNLRRQREQIENSRNTVRKFQQ